MGPKLYVQYGCGFSSPAGWLNYDASPTLRFERLPLIGRLYTKNAARFPADVKYGDIIRGLPLTPGSCAGIYASHVLEHLSLNDFRIALNNTYRLLHSGGIFRLVVPDLQGLASRYLESSEASAAENFLRETSLGIEGRPRGLRGLVQMLLGNSCHLWMWDFKGIQKELMTTGFVSVRRCELGDSADPMFELVESADRFVNAVAVEAIKP